MSFWIILSWIFVLLLTAINAVVFFKLKGASEQMLKMAFPNAKNMNDALSQMQGMMGGMQGMAGGGKGFGGGGKGFNNAKSFNGGMPRALSGAPRGGSPSMASKNPDAQLKAAMDMLKNMPKGGKK